MQGKKLKRAKTPAPRSKRVKRHPSAIAWEKWLLSGEGIKCTDGVARAQYLKNRLWRAFMAGYAAIPKSSKRKVK